MIRSASPGRGSPGGTMCRSTSGSAASGSRSSKFAARFSRGTAILIAPCAAERTPLEVQRVLGRQQARLLEPRHDAVVLHARARRDHRMRVVEQPGIAAELVDQIAMQALPLGRLQQRMRAHKGRDHAAALDVADQHHGQIGRLGKAHIGDVALAQVDLGRAAGTLDQHEIRLAPERQRSSRAPPASGPVSGRHSRAPENSREPCPGPRAARRPRSAASRAPGSCAPRAARRRRAPAAPGRGRSRRRPASPRRCCSCSAA